MALLLCTDLLGDSGAGRPRGSRWGLRWAKGGAGLWADAGAAVSVSQHFSQTAILIKTKSMPQNIIQKSNEKRTSALLK